MKRQKETKAGTLLILFWTTRCSGQRKVHVYIIYRRHAREIVQHVTAFLNERLQHFARRVQTYGSQVAQGLAV